MAATDDVKHYDLIVIVIGAGSGNMLLGGELAHLRASTPSMTAPWLIDGSTGSTSTPTRPGSWVRTSCGSSTSI